MKETFIYTVLMFVIFSTASCVTTDDYTPNTAIELPPYETMAVDFNNFMDTSPTPKSNSLEVGVNWLYPRIVIGVWNTALFTTLAVPVASFKEAFAHTPELLPSGLWQWTYTVDGFSSQYSARLTGQHVANTVQWKMYVSKTGVEAFDEFLWFSGTSNKEATQGVWILNQGPNFAKPMIQIDWTRNNNEIENILYTWIRPTNDQGQPDLFQSSYLAYGKADAEFDVYYNIHAFDSNSSLFNDVNIEWNSTDFTGRVKSPSYFLDQEWHCWNSAGEDISCE